MPIFVLPPLVSLIYAFVLMRRPRHAQNEANLEWLAIVSAVNLILTGIILYKFHFSPVELMSQLVDLIRGAVNRLLFSPPKVEPGPRVIPL